MQIPNMISEAGPTQPPHPSLVVDVPSGYPGDFETFGTPDTVDVADIFSVDMTPLASISTSGMHAISCPDMSVDGVASMSVDFDDRIREIRNPLTSVIESGAYSPIRNPSKVTVHEMAIVMPSGSQMIVLGSSRRRIQNIL